MTRRTTVLLIATDGLTRLTTFNSLMSFGLEVLVASDAEEAVHRLRSGMRFDVVITDADLGGDPDGLAVAQVAREVDRSIHVIYVARQPHRIPEKRKVSGAPVVRSPYWPQQMVGIIGELRGRSAVDRSVA